MIAPVSSAEAAALRPFVPASLMEEERVLSRTLDDYAVKYKHARAALDAARESAREAVLERNRLQKQYKALGDEWSAAYIKVEDVRERGWTAAREAMAEAARLPDAGQGGAR